MIKLCSCIAHTALFGHIMFLANCNTLDHVCGPQFIYHANHTALTGMWHQQHSYGFVAMYHVGTRQ